MFSWLKKKNKQKNNVEGKKLSPKKKFSQAKQQLKGKRLKDQFNVLTPELEKQVVLAHGKKWEKGDERMYIDFEKDKVFSRDEWRETKEQKGIRKKSVLKYNMGKLFEEFEIARLSNDDELIKEKGEKLLEAMQEYSSRGIYNFKSQIVEVKKVLNRQELMKKHFNILKVIHQNLTGRIIKRFFASVGTEFSEVKIPEEKAKNLDAEAKSKLQKKGYKNGIVDSLYFMGLVARDLIVNLRELMVLDPVNSRWLNLLRKTLKFRVTVQEIDKFVKSFKDMNALKANIKEKVDKFVPIYFDFESDFSHILEDKGLL